MINMTETDKSRDVRQGASRFSRHIKQSGYNSHLFSGLNGEPKERIKKLSSVNKTSTWNCNQNQNIVALDREEEFPSRTPSKRFKMRRKQFLDDCNAVDHASVPRKLRSAMKKRSGESMSRPFPDSKKVNQPIGAAKRNAKQANPNWCPKPQTCGPITKDEEEVVDTLYNLAGMFSGNELKDKINLEDSDNLSAFQEGTDNPQPQPTIEGSVDIKEDASSIVHLESDEAVHPASNKERSPEKNIQIIPLKETTVHESANRCSSQNHHGESDSSITPLIMPGTLAKHEQQKLVCNSVNMCSVPLTYQNTVNLTQPAKLEASPLNIKPKIAFGQTTLIGSRLPQQLLIDESNRNGLSPAVLNGAFRVGPSQSSVAKIPAWLDAAISATRPGTNGPLMGKVSKVNTDRRSWKRCAYHAYISHLIQVFKVPVGKDSLELHQYQLRPHDIMKQGVLMTINDFNGVKNGLNGTTSSFEKVDILDKNSNEARSCIFQNQKAHQTRPQATLASGMYTSQKQDFNLSLSAGVTETDPKNSLFVAGKGLALPAQLQVPLAHHVQHPTLMPFPVSQTSNNLSFPDQPSAVTATAAHQARLQLPSYVGTQLHSPHASPLALKQQQQHPQNGQRLWMTHPATQYRTAGTSPAMSQSPGWQNGRQDINPLIGCAHAITPPSPSPSPSSLEVLGPRYPQISQRQQIMAMTSSLPHARVKIQGQNLSSIYEETGNVFKLVAHCHYNCSAMSACKEKWNKGYLEQMMEGCNIISFLLCQYLGITAQTLA